MHLKGKNLVDLDKANDLIDLKNQIIQDEYQDDNAFNIISDIDVIIQLAEDYNLQNETKIINEKKSFWHSSEFDERLVQYFEWSWCAVSGKKMTWLRSITQNDAGWERLL